MPDEAVVSGQGSGVSDAGGGAGGQQQAAPAGAGQGGDAPGGGSPPADPFARPFTIPWDQIEGAAANQGGQQQAAPAGEGQQQGQQQQQQAPGGQQQQQQAPAGGQAQSQEQGAQAGQQQAGQQAAAGQQQAGGQQQQQQQEGAPDPVAQVAARVEQIGGAPVLEMVAPLFEVSPDLGENVAKARTFVQQVSQFHPAIRNGLVNAVFEEFKPIVTAWADEARGITTEGFEGYKAWDAAGRPSAVQTPVMDSFPVPDEKGLVKFADGMELDTTDPFHKEVYEMKKERFERGKAEAKAAADQVQAQQLEIESKAAEREQGFLGARIESFTTQWAAAKPNYQVPGLDFDPGELAMVYAQFLAGSNGQALAGFQQGKEAARLGGTAADTIGSKIDLLAGEAIKTAVERIDKLVQMALGQAARQTHGDPVLPGQEIQRTGVQVQTAVAGQQNGGRKFSLDDPSTFAGVIPS